MIVVCEQCQTQFQLDDARVPESGVKVRCSRCKHAFFVKPRTSAGDLVENAVERALEAAGATTQELPSDDEAFEDWEFNDEAPFEPGPGAPDDAELSAAREAVDDLLGGGSASAEVHTPAEVHVQEPCPEEVPTHLEVREEPEPPRAGDGLDDLFDTDPGIEQAPDALAAPPLAVEEPMPPAEAEPVGEAALGSPENWNFFDEEPAGVEPAPEPAEAPAAAGGAMRIALGRIGSMPRRRPVPVEVEAEPSKAAIWLGRAGHAAGWLAVSLLVLQSLHVAVMAPAQAPPGRRAQTLGVLEAREVTGRWVENAVAGDLFVVSGLLGVPAGRATTPGIRLAVRLYAANGAVIAEEAAAVGPELPTARLREDHPRELRARQASEALAMAWTALPAGAERRFHAVLAELPAEASRFDLVAIPVEEPSPVPEEYLRTPASPPSPHPASG